MAASSQCPICHKTAKAREDNPSFPFCSARCKTIDLGNWMNESYRVPVEPEEGGEGEGPSASGQETDDEREGDPGGAGASSKSGPLPREPVRH